MAIAQILAQILAAQYGKDVRQAIHDGIEECYSDVSTAKTLAEDATLDANEAAENANDSVISGVVVFGDDLVFQNAGGGTIVADDAMKGVHDATILANEKAGLADTAATGANAAKVSTEAATVSALGAQNANANWTKDTANPLSYFPAPSAPLYFRREGTFTQEGSGDPSPTNIRPITPFMANGETVELMNCAKNRIPFPYLHTTKTENGITFSVGSDGVITVNGTASSDTAFLMMQRVHKKILPFGNYVFSGAFGGSITGGFFQLFVNRYTLSDVYDRTEVSIMGIGASGNFSVSPIEYDQMTYDIGLYIQSGATLSNFIVKPQLELGSVATPYEPYVGSTATLTAPEEIAAGWINNRGEGQKTWGRKVFDGTEIFVANAADGGKYNFSSDVPDIIQMPVSMGNTYPPLVCTHYPPNTLTNVYNRILGICIMDSYIRISDPVYEEYSDPSYFKAYLAAQYAAGTPVTIYYQLATPQTITPVSVALNSIPATDLATERLNVFTSSLSGVLTYPKNKVRQDRILNNAQLWRKTASGNPVSMYPVPESPLYPKVSGTFTQAGTGDPSPENIRPITPWLASGASAKVKRTGKNLCSSIKSITANGAQYMTVTGDIISINNTSGSTQYPCIVGVRVPPGTYRVTMIPVSGTLPTLYVMRNGADYTEQLSNASPQRTITITAEVSLILMFVVDAGLVSSLRLQFEIGSVSTPYEPYSGQEITLTAPQEIAAGWMDNEGNGQATWGKFSPSVGAVQDIGTHVRVAAGHVGNPKTAPSTNANSFCSHLVHLANYSSDTPHYYLDNTGVYLFIPKALLSTYDVAGVNAWLSAQLVAGTPLTFVYELATPASITPAFAPLTATPQLDRTTPRQNVLIATPAMGIELTYAKSPIREADELAAAIALL